MGTVTLSFPPPRRSIGVRRHLIGLTRPRERAGEGTRSWSFARAVLIATMIVITALALLYLWQGWQLTELRSRLAIRQAAVEHVMAENQVLRLKVEQAFSLERIELFAKTILGMVEPPLQYLYLPEEGG